MTRSGGRSQGAVGCLYEHRSSVSVLLALACGLALGAYSARLTSRALPPANLSAARSDCVDDVRASCPPATCDCPAEAAAAPSVQACAPCPELPQSTTLKVDSELAADGLDAFYLHDPKLRPVAADMADASVCMVVRTFVDHRNILMALLASVLLWDHPSLAIYLLDTGKDAPFSDMPALAKLASRMSGRPGAVRISRWTHATSRAKFPGFADEDHGYIATDLTLEDILAERADAAAKGVPGASLPCEHLIITNGDNLYGHDYLAATLGEMQTGAEMVNTHWVSHYEMNKAWILGWGEIQNGHCGPWRPGRDGEIAASPVFMKGCVDLGVVTFKTKLLEESGFRFAVDRLRTLSESQAPPKEMFAGMNSLFYADGAFFERLYKRFSDAGQTNKTRMIRRALFVHQ